MVYRCPAHNEFYVTSITSSAAKINAFFYNAYSDYGSSTITYYTGYIQISGDNSTWTNFYANSDRGSTSSTEREVVTKTIDSSSATNGIVYVRGWWKLNTSSGLKEYTSATVMVIDFNNLLWYPLECKSIIESASTYKEFYDEWGSYPLSTWQSFYNTWSSYPLSTWQTFYNTWSSQPLSTWQTFYNTWSSQPLSTWQTFYNKYKGKESSFLDSHTMSIALRSLGLGEQ